MRIVRRPTYRDFQYNMKEIENDYKRGLITREEARKLKDTITKAFQTKSNLKKLHEAEEAQEYNKRNFMVEK